MSLEEEKKLANQLKSMCDENKKEKSSQSFAVLHKLAQVYSKRDSDKINLIKIVALYNAAIARLTQNIAKSIQGSCQNKLKIEKQLTEFCNKILKQANAKQQNVDLVATAKNNKKKSNQTES